MSNTYGEQIRKILSEKHMTIEAFANLIEQKTGMKMSRQNLTQRLKRDNFQEQDMRLFAEVLGYYVKLDVISKSQEIFTSKNNETVEELGQDIKISTDNKNRHKLGFIDIIKKVNNRLSTPKNDSDQSKQIEEIQDQDDTENVQSQKEEYLLEEEINKDEIFYAVPMDILEMSSSEEPKINELTGEEYESNTVRTHPHLVGYIQVYEREKHRWFDMTQWAFMGYQERKKLMLQDDYKEPIYID